MPPAVSTVRLEKVGDLGGEEIGERRRVAFGHPPALVRCPPQGRTWWPCLDPTTPGRSARWS